MPGRKPKPIAVKIAEGDRNNVGKRKLQAMLDQEVKATRGLPACPRHLKGRARSAWAFLARELGEMGLDCLPDAMMLEGACVNYQRAVASDLVLAKQGLTVTESAVTKTGQVVVLKVRKHPCVDISSSSWRNFRAFASEFGLSPAARVRVHADRADNSEDDLMRILMTPRSPHVSKPS